MKKIVIFLLVLFVLSVQQVFAVVSFIPQSSKDIIAGTLAIEQSTQLTFPKGSSPNIHVHVFNSSGLLVTGALCTIHLQDNLDYHFLIANLDATENGYNLTLSTNYTQRIGLHNYVIWCNQTTTGGFTSGQFEVTQSGEERNINTPLIIIIAIIFAIGIFLLGAAYSEIAMITISGMLFIVIGIYILINGFNNLNNYLTVSLSIVLLGIGMFVSIRPYIDDIIESFNKL